MKKLKTAVIGVGGMGRNHARILSKLTDLKAVVDINKENGMAVATLYNAKYYASYEKMLEEEEIDAVTIAAPTSKHEQIAIYCLKSGINVLLEKPIAENAVQARKIIAAAKKEKAVLMIGHIERFNPAITKLKKLADQKHFGRIVNIGTIRVGVSPPKTPHSDVVLDLAIHDIDIFNYILNDIPLHVSVVKDVVFRGNLADAGVMILKYKKTIGSIQTNWISPTKMRKLYITGTERSAELDYINQTLVVLNKQKIATSTKNFKSFMASSEIIAKNVEIKKQEPLEAEILHFLKMVRQHKTEDSQYAIDALVVATTKPKL